LGRIYKNLVFIREWKERGIKEQKEFSILTAETLKNPLDFWCAKNCVAIF
jgi:hypothetical protein